MVFAPFALIEGLKHACMYAHAHTCMCARTYTHARTHACMHAHAHTHAHTHTHTEHRVTGPGRAGENRRRCVKLGSAVWAQVSACSGENRRHHCGRPDHSGS